MTDSELSIQIHFLSLSLSLMPDALYIRAMLRLCGGAPWTPPSQVSLSVIYPLFSPLSLHPLRNLSAGYRPQARVWLLFFSSLCKGRRSGWNKDQPLRQPLENQF